VTSNSAPLWRRRRSSRFTDTAPRVAVGTPPRDLLSELALLRFGGDFEQARLAVNLAEDRAHKKCGHMVCSSAPAVPKARRCMLCQRGECDCNKPAPAEALAPGWSACGIGRYRHVTGAFVYSYADSDGYGWFYAPREADAATALQAPQSAGRDEAMACSLGWEHDVLRDAWVFETPHGYEGRNHAVFHDLVSRVEVNRSTSVRKRHEFASLPHAIAWCRGEYEKPSHVGVRDNGDLLRFASAYAAMLFAIGCEVDEREDGELLYVRAPSGRQYGIRGKQEALKLVEELRAELAGAEP
jgi:hypothetical protein